MKISPLTDAFRFMSSVRSKRNEGDGGNERQQYDPNQNRKDDQQESSEQPNPQDVEQAVASFHTDASTLASGLSASVEGTGPGLKILVKDVNGTLLRQFSGEEFVRMRTGSSKDFRTRGKILDQKL